MLHQHRWWLHCQQEDQDSKLHIKPYLAVVQMELVPDASDLSQLR